MILSYFFPKVSNWITHRHTHASTDKFMHPHTYAHTYFPQDCIIPLVLSNQREIKCCCAPNMGTRNWFNLHSFEDVVELICFLFICWLCCLHAKPCVRRQKRFEFRLAHHLLFCLQPCSIESGIDISVSLNGNE